MKMRKLMAVVLAVVVAISAMAISAFATEYEEIKIELTNASTTDSTSASVSWTVPAYAIFGYLNNGDTITLWLPTNLAAYGSKNAYDITYTLTVNGVTVTLQGVSASSLEEIYATDDGKFTTDVTAAKVTSVTTSAGTTKELTTDCYTWLGYKYDVFEQTVNVGFFAKNYSSVSGYATIPQSTLVSENTPVTITATVTDPDGGDVDADDLLPVANYTNGNGWQAGAFASGWTSSSVTSGTYVDADLSTVDANKVAYGSDSNSYSVVGYDWDNTLQTSLTMYGNYMSITYTPVDGTDPTTIYACDIVDFGSITKTDATTTDDDVVIIIADTTSDSSTGEALYWDHTLANRAIVATAAATEGAYAEVVIDLSTYGTGYIKGLAVYTLYANASVDAAENSSSALWYGSSLYNTTVSTYLLNGTTTELRFPVDVSYLYDTTYGVYNGSFYVYQLVSTGTSTSSSNVYTNRNSWDDNTSLSVASDGGAYLVIYMPVDDTSVDVENPVESTDTETEDDDMEVVDEDEPVEAEPETNPTTGIVLALVPMAVAAAAAVASKRR